MQTLDALARYFVAVLRDGDWANDWLTHLPPALADITYHAGHLLALIVGS